MHGMDVCELLLDVECFFFFQAEDGIRDYKVTGVQTCALPISGWRCPRWSYSRPSHCTSWSTRRSSATSAGSSWPAWPSRSEERRVGKEGRTRWSPDH